MVTGVTRSGDARAPGATDPTWPTSGRLMVAVPFRSQISGGDLARAGPCGAAAFGQPPGFGGGATVGHPAPAAGAVAALVEEQPTAAAFRRRAAAYPGQVGRLQHVERGLGDPVGYQHRRYGAVSEPYSRRVARGEHQRRAGGGSR